MAEAAYFGAPDGTVTCRWQDGEAPIASAHFAVQGLTANISSLDTGRREKIDAVKGLDIAEKGGRVNV